MFERFSYFPAFRILLLCAVGYFLSSVYDLTLDVVVFFLVICLIIGLVLLSVKQNFLALAIMSLAIGLWFFYQTDSKKLQTPKKIIGEFPALVEGRILDVLKNEDNYLRIIVRGKIDSKILPELNNNGILLNIYGEKVKTLNLTNETIISTKIKARLPFEKIIKEDFNEKMYCASLDVQWLGRAQAEDVSIIEKTDTYDCFKELKEFLQTRINFLFQDNTKAVMTAMILGDKSLISQELRAHFSLSGTAHLLAVSGLHVGIIAFFIYFLLSFIRLKWLKFLIFSILTIFYVILSGLQESAIRAGFMCIIVAYLHIIERQIYPLNILSFSIIILLIIKPTLIYSPGFQMSVASVGGIILLFNPIKNLFRLFIKSENYLIDKILSSLSLTISASASVTPIVAYYFDIVSFVSPLANLFVVPLISLAFVFGILSIFFSFISFQIAEIYALSTNFLISISEQINSFSISLPFAYWKNLDNLWIIILLSVAVFFLALSKNKRQLIFRLAFSILFILMMSYILILEQNFKIVPREKFVAIISELKNSETLLFLIDRKPHQTKAYDSGLMKFIKSSENNLSIGYNGLAGSAFIDKVNQIKNFNTVQLDNQGVRRLKGILNLNEQIPQIIKY